MNTQKPSVGRIVHYFDRETPDLPQAALITKVWSDECVNLKVFGNACEHTEDCVVTSAIFGKDKARDSGAWDWPVRV